MLEIRNLTKRYKGVPAVENVNFTIRPGEILGYIGPNGAGKSTTVKMIIGLLDPSDGQILFQGRSVIEDLPEFQRRLGYVPEEPNLYPYLSGWEYLLLAGRLRGLPRKAIDPKIEEFLHIFSLWEDRHCPLSAYSKGMRQKLLLSAALLHNPELLILDEPLSGLDARSIDVLGLVMKEGAVLVTVGTVVGLACAWGVMRLLSASVEPVARTAGASPSDPMLLIGAPLLLAVLALVACYAPARKSMRIDPVVALRQE